ncbi:hypothetical protein E3O42_07035 [Cryobacterium adonitolivorans]|uniref:Uncharacterized protein n=1 Tax=Cryobacterium adonitolivorans TaxID=1259189 RepID=A0A4R8W906_9MICO|nr:hypothetical protein [Cryobacterium adonitolivorans]TFC03186.1 hypothetical protein E3O42_07035 [Cryobacterium adonitolivorans]
MGFWFAVILVQELAGAPTWARYPAIVLAAFPTLSATLFVLAATPRSHLLPVRESVLAHFFVLRGWRQFPARVPDQRDVPAEFLHERPELRTVAIGLAHPGLLLVGGAGSSLLVLTLGRVDLTLVM